MTNGQHFSSSSDTKRNYMYHYKNYYSQSQKPNSPRAYGPISSLDSNVAPTKNLLMLPKYEDRDSSKKYTSNKKNPSWISKLLGNLNLPFSFNLDSITQGDDAPIIEVLGISLYLDDIIILCLLFILYKEETKDEMLFISLILLLLS